LNTSITNITLQATKKRRGKKEKSEDTHKQYFASKRANVNIIALFTTNKAIVNAKHTTQYSRRNNIKSPPGIIHC
jgi:hypothetical protein